MQLIKPNEYIFAFDFKAGVCYKKLTGACSLDEVFDERKSKKNTKNRSDKSYCQRLYLALLKNEVHHKDISIHKTGCGHYDFTNGRHRICICQRKNLEIEAEITYDGDPLCEDCKKKNKPKNIQTITSEDYTVIVGPMKRKK